MSQSFNQQVAVKQQPKFSVAIATPSYQKLMHNTLGDPERVKRFTSAITAAVAVNAALQECDNGTILSGALQGEALNLAPSPQLGQYYLVPFKQKERRDRQGNVIQPAMTKAQFVLGYKGYIQLAVRSGQYKRLNVMEIKVGELIRFDPLNEEIQCKIIEDYEEREAAPTIGYYAMFEYLNGFRKAIYWSKEKMIAHADKFSPAFSAEAYKKLEAGEIADHDMWRYSSFWYKNFDDMAKKTMLRQLISRWGIMSTELQQALIVDSTLNEFSENGEIITMSEQQIEAVSPQQIEQPEATDIVEQVDLSEI